MRSIFLAALLALSPLPALAQSACGGNFNSFLQGLINEAPKHRIDKTTATNFLKGVRRDPAVIRADQSQGVFQRPFVDFSRRLISNDRINRGRSNGQKYKRVFDRIQSRYGVDRGVLLAFWAFETDFGSIQGNFNTANALVTLAHDCRRPELFRPQIFAAMELYKRGEFSPSKTTGAWAGEIGMVQMLPHDILENGTDGDGDGRVSLKTSAPDALMSGGKMLSSLGWRAGEPWIDEVIVPQDFDWSLTGLNTKKRARDWAALGVKPRDGRLSSNLPASLILPQGRRGPAFLTYPNFDVYFEWNQSFTYVLTAAYFATRLNGAQVYNAGKPEKGLSGNQMKRLQRALRKRGHDVGKVDGILGAKTRTAVQKEQQRFKVPADAWPTPAFLSKLEGRTTP
ncbi:lytic murein transglycosylase [Sulfitobacter donghicola]|uniref:Lytic transglycosylase n=1 Tax=Sulfitobacter donghicola DSW-25 = KCTC 12864 = JCM 14565 TaxID=1300350 RepID=A0A073INC1_9RHOB|nr:lytic murein transglycosylase [Sulfitobacter donghicola]KEJ90981.1 lytic transglycosylase [Sulfitobacter donghicola DSW-25 = KCTC 12864 = JCM 14565]KIN68275.1 Lytic murein transglycosylase [Sulfitobacter donghicola DSW-25 = KCTC 12864 = JCM 14565]